MFIWLSYSKTFLVVPNTQNIILMDICLNGLYYYCLPSVFFIFLTIHRILWLISKHYLGSITKPNLT